MSNRERFLFTSKFVKEVVGKRILDDDGRTARVGAGTMEGRALAFVIYYDDNNERRVINDHLCRIWRSRYQSQET